MKQEVPYKTIDNCSIRVFMNKYIEIRELKNKLHKNYRLFYSKKTPPLLKRIAGCRIVELKKQLSIVCESEDYQSSNIKKGGKQ